MNKIKGIWKYIALGVFLAIVAAFVVVEQPVKADGGGGLKLDLTFGEIKELVCLVKECPKETPKQLGAITSPDIPSNYIGVGGLRTHSFGASLAASSTACSFTPDFGTTTIKSLSFQTVGTTTATTLTIAKATNNTNATTTALAYHDFAAGVKGTYYLTASTSDATAAGNGVDGSWTLAPNDVLNFDVQGLVEGGEDPATGLTSEGWTLGTCGGELIVH